MRCLSCGFDNPEGMKYCGQCGTPLPQRCLICDFVNPPNFKFCGQCGASLEIKNEELRIKNEALEDRDEKREANNQTAAYQPPPDYQTHHTLLSHQTAPLDAERRQLTVMFCDLVGSTALSEQLDPEDFTEVIQAYQQTAVEVMEQYNGFVAQYLGDGLLIYFGYPTAHEYDAQRAVLAGLSIIEELQNLNIRLQQTMRTANQAPLQLAVRVGVHTGLVVVGELGGGDRREQMALGETMNIAARLQHIAESDTLVISAATHQLIEGFFACRPLGPQSLRGISYPMETYQVLRKSRIHNRLDAVKATTSTLSPLVGRESEMTLLMDRWTQAEEGQGQVVLIEGESGIGKSRLVRVFKERLTGRPHLWFSCHGSPYHQITAFFPIVELLERVLRLKKQDLPERKLIRLEMTLRQYGLPLAEAVPLFAGLLSLPLPNHYYPPLNLSPQRQKQELSQAFLLLLLRLTKVRPVVILIEDLHWVDPSTLEILDILIGQASEARVLALFTYRPTFKRSWHSHTALSRLSLARLTHEETRQLAQSVVGGKVLPVEVLEQIIAKTDGIPIFIEELTKMILEQDILIEQEDRYLLDGPLPTLAIPTTLHDSLMARLDRLASVREVVQLGAVLGRAFSYRLLQAVASMDEATLQRDLAQLVEAELLYQGDALPEATYTFKHALVQETAYRSLLRRRRQYYHQKVAQVLIEKFPQICEQEPELLAHHCTVAGMHQEAVSYWRRAGERAVKQSANIEAVTHFSKALDLLKALPETSEQLEQELHLRIALGAPLLMTKGYAAPEVEANYARARELCWQLNDTPQLASVLFGLWVFYLVSGRYDTAVELGHKLMRLAEQMEDSALLLEAHRMQGLNYFNLAELGLAQNHLEKALEIYDPDQHGPRILADASTDRGVACLSHLALSLWLLGYPDQALARCRQSLTLAEELGHPYSRAFARCWAAWLHQLRGEVSLTLEMAEESRELAAEQGFTLLQLISSIVAGWALIKQGQIEAGLARMTACLSKFKETGAQLGQLYFWVLLADAYLTANQVEQGLATVEEALGKLAEKGERFYEAELYRLKGELLMKQFSGGEYNNSAVAEVESQFQRALKIARGQQLESLALRAAMSLARFWNQQGQAEEAGQLLAEIYQQFTEGFDTSDFQEAQALLQAVA